VTGTAVDGIGGSRRSNGGCPLTLSPGHTSANLFSDMLSRYNLSTPLSLGSIRSCRLHVLSSVRGVDFDFEREVTASDPFGPHPIWGLDFKR